MTTGSRVSVNTNAITATAFGNETGQTLALNATNLMLDPSVATLSGSNGDVFADGAATVTSLQANYNSDIVALLAGSTLVLIADSQGGVGADSLTGNTLELTGNAQDVLAAGNSGSNTLSLEGNTVGGASGLASVQVGENTSVVAELNTVLARITAQTDVEGGTIDLSGNTMQARAFGGSASNSVSVTGTMAELDSVADAGTSAGTVVSNYGLLNRQIGDGTTVMATADASDGGFNVGVAGNLQNATTANDANRLVGLAFGNQASNTTSINVGTITTDDTDGNAQVANALNMQNVTGNVSARATGGSVMHTYVQGNVTGSSVSTSDNLIRAQATGNLATTSTTVDANSLSTSQLAAVVGTISTDAAFSVENKQDSFGMVSASQLDAAFPATQSTNIRTSIEGIDGFGIIGSTVLSNTNISETRATANDATNLMTIAANSAATSSAVRNEQTSGGVVTAQMGIAGTPPVAPANFTLGGSGSTADLIGGAGTTVEIGSGDSATINFDNTAAGGSILASMLADMGASVTDGTAVFGEGVYSFADFDSFSRSFDSFTGLTTLSFTGFSTGGSPGVSPAGGVTIASTGSAILDSTLSVAGNVSRGAVTGNSATNVLSVQATSITGDLGGLFREGEATHVLANTQGNGAELASSVTAGFAVESAEGGTIAGSSISVSDNVQMATAVANTARSTLSFDGGDGAAAASVAASSELSSVQGSFDYVTATSTMQASAAATMNGSSLAIEGNRNTALAVANDATNASNIRATNAATTSTADANASLTGALFNSTADHLVSNRQSGDAPITATAQSNIFNQDLLATGTTGIANSSVSMSGNATVAEASTNRATNSLTLDAGADLGATGGVMNSQTSEALVTASASSDVSMGLTGFDGFATVSGSSLAIEGNTTTALARSNFAGNVLNASAGAGYAPQVAGSSANAAGSGQTVTANYAVLNTQQNFGAINASSTGTTHRATPAGATSSDAMAMGSSLRVGGNLVAAEAFGNQASNSLQMAGLNSTMPTAAIGNTQRNTGSVTSNVSGASVGISGTGTVGTSGFGVTGNTISAAATGNSVTNRINGN